jgi:hypothetical protein
VHDKPADAPQVMLLNNEAKCNVEVAEDAVPMLALTLQGSPLDTRQAQRRMRSPTRHPTMKKASGILI